MKQIAWFLFITLSMPLSSFCQEPPRSVDSTAVYKVRPLLSLGLSLTSTVLTRYGNDRNLNKPMLSVDERKRLQAKDVIFFDRVALHQDITKSERILHRSNIAALAGLTLPAFLLLDRQIRHDWIDIISIFLESQAASSLLHTWGPLGPTFINRIRPAAYYEGSQWEDDAFAGQRNSFYSGRVASVATASFFMAKVLDDYHPEWKGKKWLFYGMALVPPTVVGAMRVRSTHNYPSDVVAGTVFGALTGVLLPELHRIKEGRAKLSFQYGKALKGMAFHLTF